MYDVIHVYADKEKYRSSVCFGKIRCNMSYFVQRPFTVGIIFVNSIAQRERYVSGLLYIGLGFGFLFVHLEKIYFYIFRKISAKN